VCGAPPVGAWHVTAHHHWYHAAIHHLCATRISGTTAIRSQIHRAEAFLVSGSTERHPARWPSWGRPHSQTGGLFFVEHLLQRWAET